MEAGACLAEKTTSCMQVADGVVVVVNAIAAFTSAPPYKDCVSTNN